MYEMLRSSIKYSTTICKKLRYLRYAMRQLVKQIIKLLKVKKMYKRIIKNFLLKYYTRYFYGLLPLNHRFSLPIVHDTSHIYKI